MTKDEALKMCLEYIETDAHERKYVRHAIKKALAQPWEKFCDSNCVWTDHHPDCKLAQPEHIGFMDSKLNPIQRTWVGLTEEDLKLLSAEWRIVYGAWMDDFARDIEAKIKEKNT